MEIEKTNRMNALFEFYEPLLTDKQHDYMQLYYGDDYSLGEIADEFSISRQAVYDNIKRTEKILEDYERKLHLFSDFKVREEMFDAMRVYLQTTYPDDEVLQGFISQFEKMDEE